MDSNIMEVTDDPSQEENEELDEDDEEEEIQNWDEELIKHEPDLKDWKIEMALAELDKLDGRLSQSKGANPRINISNLRPYLNEMREALTAKEVPKEMTVDDYIIRLNPPTDNDVYNNAVLDIEQQVSKRANYKVKLTCPLKCKTTFETPMGGRRHVRQVHLKLKLFQCKKCGVFHKTLQSLKYHVESKHLDKKYECEGCEQIVSAKSTVNFHAKVGHATPTGEKVFISSGRRQIKYELFEEKFITESYGFTYQLVAIPWEDGNGELVDLSIMITRFQDWKEMSSKLWKWISKKCEEFSSYVADQERQDQEDNNDPYQGDETEDGSWVEACGSARQEYRKGRKMRPDLAFPLKLYGVGFMVACQLKWFARLYYDAVMVLGTDESKYFLEPFNDEIKSILNSHLDNPHMPQKTKDYVKLNGEDFKFANVK